MTTATETTPVRVLIADDQTLFRTGVARLLSDETDMEVVAEAADGEQAVRLAGETKPDLVLMPIGGWLLEPRGFQRLPVASGAALLVGSLGVAKTELAPTGIVRAGSDEWSAVSEGGPIPQGAAVRVRRVDGLRLIVGPEASSSGRRES